MILIFFRHGDQTVKLNFVEQIIKLIIHGVKWLKILVVLDIL